MRSLFLSPQSGVCPSISSSVVQCSVFLLVCISVPVFVVYLCPSSVCLVATFSGTVLFPLLYIFLPFYNLVLYIYIYTHTHRVCSFLVIGLYWCFLFNLSITSLLSENKLQALAPCSREYLESVLENKDLEGGGS